MEIDVIEGPGERLFADPRRLQHLDSVLVAQDARFPGPGAQGVGELGGSPVSVHVDHGRYLPGLTGSVPHDRSPLHREVLVWKAGRRYAVAPWRAKEYGWRP